MASGLLLGLAAPPFHLILPSFLALVPWAVWTARQPSGPEGFHRSLRGGLWLGTVQALALCHWLLFALWSRGIRRNEPLEAALALPGFLVLVGGMALLTAAAGGWLHRAVRERGVPLWLALPVGWTALEWVRAHLGPLAFPWMQLGESLTGYPRLIGAAELVGARGLSFWLALANGLVACLLLRRGRAGLLVPALLVAVALPPLYSLVRWRDLELLPAARVLVVQPDVPAPLKDRPRAAADSALRVAEGLPSRAGTPAAPPDLVVLPESALPLVLYPPSPPSPADAAAAAAVENRVERLAARLEAPLLVGAFAASTSEGGVSRRFNAAFLVEPGGGSGSSPPRYAKRRLVPVVEGSLLPGLLRQRAGSGGAFAPGRDPGLHRLPGAVAGVTICYESAFQELFREQRKGGADLFVNLTNDGWFGGGEGPLSRSSALVQHPAHLVMRAVENRAGVVRAANTGISMLVDPLGRVTRRTGLFRTGTLRGIAWTTDGTTIFTRRGDLAGTISALAVLGVALASAAGGWRRGSSGVPEPAGAPSRDG